MATTERVGKLDTSVNGPHDDDLGWDLQWEDVRWEQIEEDVRRLRRRIFKASQVGDLKRVRSLQKLMLRSQANTLHSVRRVTSTMLAARPRALTGGSR